MEFKIGDLVTRNSHNNDIIFKIIKIEEETCQLKGVNVRLVTDSKMSDLKAHNDEDIEEEKPFLERINRPKELNRDDFFYLPGKILHIDGDIHLSNKPSNPVIMGKNGNLKNLKIIVFYQNRAIFNEDSAFKR